MGVSGMAEEPKRQDKDAQENNEKDFISWNEKDTSWGKLKKFFFENPTLVLSLLYLFVTGTGIIYSFRLYSQFRISIFDYSEAGDFLLAGFRNPFAILSVGSAVGVILFATRLFAMPSLSTSQEQKIDQQLRKQGISLRAIRRLKALIISSALLLGFFMAVILPLGSADMAAQAIKDGEQPSVQVRYSFSTNSGDQVTKPGLELIGATQKVVFFYDVEEQRTLAIPQSQIVLIRIPDKGHYRFFYVE